MADVLKASIRVPVRIMWRMLFPLSRAAVLMVTITNNHNLQMKASKDRAFRLITLAD
jgi:hypothetical protein